MVSSKVQIGLRIDRELLKQIEAMAEHENIDKMSWIRRALSSFLKGEQQEAATEAVEDYIGLRIDRKKLLDLTGMAKVPDDIEQSRKEVLKSTLAQEKR